MDKQYFDPNKDGFYGAYYPNKEKSEYAIIAMLGDSSEQSKHDQCQNHWHFATASFIFPLLISHYFLHFLILHMPVIINMYPITASSTTLPILLTPVTITFFISTSFLRPAIPIFIKMSFKRMFCWKNAPNQGNHLFPLRHL